MDKVNLKQIARLSGFSITTVSRVLGDIDYPVSKDARDKINRAADELGYVPNILARSLRKNSSKEVAIIMPSIVNLSYTAFISGADEVLSQNGYTMALYLAGSDGKKGLEFVKSLQGKMIRGAIVSSDCILNNVDMYLKYFKRDKISYVLADYEIQMKEPCIGVYFNYYHGGQMAARYLLNHGHKKIAYASMSLLKPSRMSRKQGFCDVMTEEKTDFNNDDVYETDCCGEFEGGIDLARKILKTKKKYTAVSASNDTVALGILHELKENGVKVPEQISVIGLDDCEFAKMSTPLLTTVRVPSYELGKISAEYILEELKGNKKKYSIYLEPEVTERESVKTI